MEIARSGTVRFLLCVGAPVVSLWSATQWIAIRLGHQPALGAPWLTLHGATLYRPWDLLIWWYRYGRSAPQLFDRAGLICVAGTGAGLVVAAITEACLNKGQPQPTTYGSARWAAPSEIRRAGLHAKGGVLLGVTNEGYLRHQGPEHILAVAPTRSGKGVGLVVPTLLSWTGSALIHDIKGENWRLTSGWRSQFSHCLLFDPTDVRSARFNPLFEIRRGANEIRDVQNVADILVDPDGALERRNHWDKTAHSLLVGAILHVLYEEENKTLAGVATFLADPTRSFKTTLEAMLHANHLGTADEPMVHPVVAATARELLNKAEDERSGVVSTALSCLSLYRDPIVAAVTERCDWRIADLVAAERPTSLYLVVPPSDIARTRSLIRLILNQIGRRVTERLPEPGDPAPRHELLMMLDEFPALGRLDVFETNLAFMAGYGIRAFLIAQSFNQIVKAYGPSSSIVDNCHIRIAFAANDEQTAARVSKALGTSTEQRAMRNHSGPRSSLWLPNVSVSQQEVARPLLTPGEVMQLPANEELVLAAGLQPIRARKLRYYEDANFRRRCLPAPALHHERYADRPAPRAIDWIGRATATGLEEEGRRAPSSEQESPEPVAASPINLVAGRDVADACDIFGLGAARSVDDATRGQRP